MACNSYQTYSSKRSCGCKGGRDSIYFPDFVANSCCNPCCASEASGSGEGCHICNGGGCGSHWDGGCSGHWDGCGGHGSGCGWWNNGCCGGCSCGCNGWHPWEPWYPWYPWYPGCSNGICPR